MDTMLWSVREVIRVLASGMPDIIKFNCLTVLRPENYKDVFYISLVGNSIFYDFPRI
jgi:hypothetical protein